LRHGCLDAAKIRAVDLDLIYGPRNIKGNTVLAGIL
jgi:hypothetical protein